jgi:site-specific recombinase XerC
MRSDELTQLKEQKKQLLGRLALRKNELRLLRIGDFDLARSEVRVQGKGGKIVILQGIRLLDRAWQGVRSEES